MDSEGTFLHCYVLDRKGGTVTTDPAAAATWSKEQGILWVHLDLTQEAARSWVRESGGLDDTIVDGLLADETRPRSQPHGDGLLVVLRGVNMNPAENPEDMVAVRIWIESDRIISTRRRRLLSVQDVRAALDCGEGPVSTGAFISVVVERLADRIGDFVDNIEERLGDAEGSVTVEEPAKFRRILGGLRRQMASVRRFLAPQRDALDRLYRQPGLWFSDEETRHLREEADRITRYLEDLDLARERAVVLQEEFLGQLAQEQNSRMYVLSVVAAIFLPLTFVTGMLGMNVGGLPGLESPNGFLASVVLMVFAAVGLAVFFRWKKWL